MQVLANHVSVGAKGLRQVKFGTFNFYPTNRTKGVQVTLVDCTNETYYKAERAGKCGFGNTLAEATAQLFSLRSDKAVRVA